MNPIDTYVRGGLIPAKLTFPYILGRDLAGCVVETGAHVKNLKPGDRVWATNQGFAGRPGTFAEFAAVDERWLFPIPQNVTDEQAVAMSLVGVKITEMLATAAALVAASPHPAVLTVRRRTVRRRRTTVATASAVAAWPERWTRLRPAAHSRSRAAAIVESRGTSASTSRGSTRSRAAAIVENGEVDVNLNPQVDQ